MPKVAAGALPPIKVAEFAGLSRPTLVVLSKAGLIAPQTRLATIDAVIARVMRSIYWYGPSSSAGGAEPTSSGRARPAVPYGTAARHNQRQVAELVATRLRGLLTPDSTGRPAMTGKHVLVDPGTGIVVDLAGRNADVGELVSATEDTAVLIPLRQWVRDAELLFRPYAEPRSA